MRRFIVLTPLALALAACSPGDLGAMRDAGQPDFDYDTDVDTDDDPGLDYEGPSFWRLDGVLEIAGGEPVAEGTVLEVQFTNADGSPWQSTEDDLTTCILQATQIVNGPDGALDGEPLLGWWQIDAVDQSHETLLCPWALPRADTAFETEDLPLIIGLGSFDSRLSPALQAAGFSTGLDLYSLYTLHPSPDGDEIYVFGVAGTEAQYAGEDTTVDAVPVPDGRYDLNTLVLLPVPESLRR